MYSITVVIQTYNEEKQIQACIESAKLLSERVLVVDTESTDKTKEQAEQCEATVVSFPYKQYVEPVRNFAVSQVETDWFFLLDADERITKDLAQEILETIEATHYSHFSVLRKNIFGNKWLQHGGWWPDTQIRLINKNHFDGWPEQIHSTPRISGKKGTLKEPLLHYFHGNVHQMVEKTTNYESIEADLLYKANKTVTVLTFFRKFIGELNRRLILKEGFRDGTVGIIESIYQAYSKTITYIYLYEKKNCRSL